MRISIVYETAHYVNRVDLDLCPRSLNFIIWDAKARARGRTLGRHPNLYLTMVGSKFFKNTNTREFSKPVP